MDSFGQQYPLMGGGWPQATSQASYSNPTSLVQNLYSRIPGVAQQGAAAADPFASQRPQYQSQQSTLMNGQAQGRVTSDIQQMREAAQQPMGGPYMGMLEKLMTDPDSITQTAGSKYEMKTAGDALARQKVAQGFLGSGNILSALQTQAQGEAAQDYSRQLGDLRSAASLSANNQNQQVSQLGEVAKTSGEDMQEQSSRLALLSGAQTGSPATAGNILANQFDWSKQLLGGLGAGGSASAGAGGGSAVAGMGYSSPTQGGYFRDQMGNLLEDTAANHQQGDSFWRNWAKSSSLSAPVYGNLPSTLFNPSASVATMPGRR